MFRSGFATLIAPVIFCSIALGAPRAKVLLVVAHPDDEYNFAATIYRLSKEMGCVVDQVVITNGEGGYKYSLLAEQIYGAPLTREEVGRERLPEIRKRELLGAGQILGIRNHYFLDQKDLRYTEDPEDIARVWDRTAILNTLVGLITRERYDLILTLLPRETTHGHHQAATLLTLEAVMKLPVQDRPAVLGGEALSSAEPLAAFTGRHGYPLTAVDNPSPTFTFDRTTKFGFKNALDYQIVVNWVIAEHKSQGMFQTLAGKHDREEYWSFSINSRAAFEKAEALFAEATRNALSAAVRPAA